MLPGAHHTNQVDNIHLGLEVVNDKLPYLQENGINHLIKATTDSFKSNYSKTIKTYCTFFLWKVYIFNINYIRYLDRCFMSMHHLIIIYSLSHNFVLSRGRCGHLFCHVCVFTIKRWVDDSFGFVNNDESTFNSLQVRCLWFGDRHKQAELFILIEPTICCLNIYCHQIEKYKKHLCIM